jgi:hypothetical protein
VTTATGSPRQARPRYGRITAFVGAVLTTFVSLSTGLGLLPAGGAPAEAAPGGSASLTAGIKTAFELPSTSSGSAAAGPGDAADDAAAARQAAAGDVAAPRGTGEGRRVVFDISRQRVWLVDEGQEVRRSYLVSGSLTDNLGPGTYEVFSRSRHASGIDGSSMDFMVRFTQGDNAAIGFHDIPEMDGAPVQTREQLGTPRSHGCVRQARPDAVALWRFAPVGTPVVVTA